MELSLGELYFGASTFVFSFMYLDLCMDMCFVSVFYEFVFLCVVCIWF